MTQPKTISINGVDYIRADTEQKAESFNGVPYQIIRTYSAGVFAGYIEKREGQEAVVRKARRIWYWDGAASLSDLAVNGTSKPQNCKFPPEVDRITLLNVVEILDCTKKAQDSIASVKVWTESK